MFDTEAALPGVLRDALDAHARAGRTAFTGPDGPVTYAELARLVDAYAAGARDVRRGELVGLAGRKGVPLVAAFLGVQAAGGCPSVVEPRLGADALAERFASVGLRRVFGVDDALDDLRGLAEHGIAVSDLRPGGGPAPRPELDPGDRAMLLFTSGSTGGSKGVLLSHRNLLVNAAGVVERTGVTPDDRLLHVMPLHHTNGVNNQVIAPLLAGATIALLPRFRAEEVPDALRAYDVTYMTGVPTMYARVLAAAGDAPIAVPSGLRFLRCGSAPITEARHRAVEDAFGVPLVVSYGLSEATCTSAMNPPGARRIGSVGTVLPGQEIGLFTPGGTDRVPAGAAGEVRIGGPAVMLGYLGDGAGSPVVEGRLATGDLGRLDDGYLTITGRIKDVIIRGGENIAPAAIESVLATHPAVRECCVVGRPDADLGEVPVAFVTVAPGGAPPTEPALQSLVRDRLARAYVPASITFLDALPVNGVGKIDRRRLASFSRR
ncbi:MAG TPA: AMP-binding protein [Streptosporangiaceae bacterium]|jgi:acyl-CoA synthetase (AMP-forming)/AMP-acid ligase II